MKSRSNIKGINPMTNKPFIQIVGARRWFLTLTTATALLTITGVTVALWRGKTVILPDPIVQCPQMPSVTVMPDPVVSCPQLPPAPIKILSLNCREDQYEASTCVQLGHVSCQSVGFPGNYCPNGNACTTDGKGCAPAHNFY